MSSGPLSDRLFSGRRQPIAFGSFFIAAPLVAGFTYLQSVTVLITMLLVAGFDTAFLVAGGLAVLGVTLAW